MRNSLSSSPQLSPRLSPRLLGYLLVCLLGCLLVSSAISSSPRLSPRLLGCLLVSSAVTSFLAVSDLTVGDVYVLCLGFGCLLLLGEAMSVSNHNVSLRSHEHHHAPCRSPAPYRSPFRLRGLSLSARSRRKEEDSLVDLVVRSQSQRLENQRAPVTLLQDPEPGPESGPGPGPEPEETVLDPQQERLLSLIHRVQSKRIDEQRVLFCQDHT